MLKVKKTPALQAIGATNLNFVYHYLLYFIVWQYGKWQSAGLKTSCVSLHWCLQAPVPNGKAVIIGTINNDAGVDFENTKLKNFVHSRLNVDTVYNIALLTIKQTIAIIDKISSNKASGYDGLRVRVIKKIAPVFENPLCIYLIFQFRQTVFLTTGK